jgi:hypothetical protein
MKWICRKSGESKMGSRLNSETENGVVSKQRSFAARYLLSVSWRNCVMQLGR